MPKVATVKTAFQMIDIWDVITPKFQSIDSYRKSQCNIESYEANHPELYLPDRQVYLDGTMQSTRKGKEAREILKHKTVEHVKMIEIDKDMIEMSRKYLTDWNQCGNIVGSTHSCFDDPRADVLSEDALAWFIDRFPSKKTVDGEERFDVRGYSANSNILSLANHGCNGTHTITVPYPSCRGLTELTVDPSKLPTTYARYNSKGSFSSSQLFNPGVERHLPLLTGGYLLPIATCQLATRY